MSPSPVTPISSQHICAGLESMARCKWPESAAAIGSAHCAPNPRMSLSFYITSSPPAPAPVSRLMEAGRRQAGVRPAGRGKAGLAAPAEPVDADDQVAAVVHAQRDLRPFAGAAGIVDHHALAALKRRRGRLAAAAVVEDPDLHARVRVTGRPHARVQRHVFIIHGIAHPSIGSGPWRSLIL